MPPQCPRTSRTSCAPACAGEPRRPSPRARAALPRTRPPGIAAVGRRSRSVRPASSRSRRRRHSLASRGPVSLGRVGRCRRGSARCRRGCGRCRQVPVRVSLGSRGPVSLGSRVRGSLGRVGRCRPACGPCRLAPGLAVLVCPVGGRCRQAPAPVAVGPRALAVPAWVSVPVSLAVPALAVLVWVSVRVSPASVLVRPVGGPVHPVGVPVVLVAAGRRVLGVAAGLGLVPVLVGEGRPGPVAVLAVVAVAVRVAVLAVVASVASVAHGPSAAGAAVAGRNSSRWAHPSSRTVPRSRLRASSVSRMASLSRTSPTVWAGPPAT